MQPDLIIQIFLIVIFFGTFFSLLCALTVSRRSFSFRNKDKRIQELLEANNALVEEKRALIRMIQTDRDELKASATCIRCDVYNAGTLDERVERTFEMAAFAELQPQVGNHYIITEFKF